MAAVGEMIVEYNGIPLQMVSLDRCVRELVYDPSNTDLLYVRWVLAFTCVYSPGGWPPAMATTGYADPKAPAGRTYSGLGSLRGQEATLGFESTPNMANPDPPTLGPGTRGVDYGRTVSGNAGYITDTQLRTRLMLPRKKLRIGWPATDKGQTEPGWWLVSPKDGRKVDAANGPFVLACDPVQISGAGLTFGVSFQVQTCLPATDADRLILSHRWEMTHVHDDDYYLTRLVDGVVIFNSAEVDAAKIEPDWLRNQFFHPIPVGFRRYLDPVTETADGLTIRYRIRDVDPTVTFDPADSGATLMDIKENIEYTVPWLANAVMSAVKNGPGWIGRQVNSIRNLFH